MVERDEGETTSAVIVLVLVSICCARVTEIDRADIATLFIFIRREEAEIQSAPSMEVCAARTVPVQLLSEKNEEPSTVMLALPEEGELLKTMDDRAGASKVAKRVMVTGKPAETVAVARVRDLTPAGDLHLTEDAAVQLVA